MDDPEYDVHPLDRDYSEPEEVAKKPKELTSEEQLRRFGVAVFGTGFGILLIVALVLGSVQRSGWVESFGSTMHRFGMVLILVGGILIIVSYRLNQVLEAWKGSQDRLPSDRMVRTRGAQ